jgi:peptide/nickel transport system permease protein
VNLYSSAIFAEVGIGALGFAPLDAITLGRAFNDMLAGGAIFQGMWWWFVPLGLVVVMISFSLLSINLGLQAIFNPRLKLSPYAV